MTDRIELFKKSAVQQQVAAKLQMQGRYGESLSQPQREFGTKKSARLTAVVGEVFFSRQKTIPPQKPSQLVIFS